MTLVGNALSRFQSWVGSLLRKTIPTELAIAPAELPLIKLSRMVIGIASPEERREAPSQLMIDSLNGVQMRFKCRDFLVEGSIYYLAVLLQGVGHVRLRVQVEWMLLSSYGHSGALKVLPFGESQEALQRFVTLQQAGARG